jgi:hypothetical protein
LFRDFTSLLILSITRSTFKPSAEKAPNDIDNNETQSIEL